MITQISKGADRTEMAHSRLDQDLNHLPMPIWILALYNDQTVSPISVNMRCTEREAVMHECWVDHGALFGVVKEVE